MNSLETHCSDNLARVLVGNKVDLISDRVVTLVEAKEVAKFYNVPYFETSAKDNLNVNECFIRMITDAADVATDTNQQQQYQSFEALHTNDNISNNR